MNKSGIISTHLLQLIAHTERQSTMQKLRSESVLPSAGRAFDIVVKGHTPQEVARYAQSLGIIQYKLLVHVDSRASQY